MTATKRNQPDPPHVTALRAALPKSMRKLPIVEIRRRAATSYAEDLSDIQYGVETPDDLKRVLNRP
jgi:hypothetical protein